MEKGKAPRVCVCVMRTAQADYLDDKISRAVGRQGDFVGVQPALTISVDISHFLPWLETVDHVSQITVPAPGQTTPRTPPKSLYFRHDQN